MYGRTTFLSIVMACLFGTAHSAEDATRLSHYQETALRIPVDGLPSGLEAVMVQPPGQGPHPLAIINHGNPRDAGERAALSASNMVPQLIEFARRGFVAVAVMRRGYGTSGGPWAEGWGSCDNPDYVRGGRAGAIDIRSAIAFMVRRRDVDGTKILAVGHSAGGFAVTALTADPPPGLVAAVNFAGGRGSTGPDHVCSANALSLAFQTFGATSRTPMLWIYAENDRFFGPELAKRSFALFRQSGGRADLVIAQPYGEDGHSLFSSKRRSTWGPIVDKFLRSNGMGDQLSRTTYVPLTPPSQLKSEHIKDFESYVDGVGHKAFAVTARGGYGWVTAARSANEAVAGAVERCRRFNRIPCTLYAVEDSRASQDER